MSDVGELADAFLDACEKRADIGRDCQSPALAG